ncbi:hypothetical protein UVI_02022090 [Ustilaginoidea virens]|uniref:Tyrosine specific protein phosphatases domain-containing protein n=1 Tax=Ustilaginoidea virens TaxID=1159556 RepID=A0A1B5L0U6_USTVR|nr:hypothetical protein UVI_02022090 [Ustilaginoidea virens]
MLPYKTRLALETSSGLKPSSIFEQSEPGGYLLPPTALALATSQSLSNAPRARTELIKQADKPDIPRIDGIVYEDIRITGRPFEIHLLRQLSWWNLLKVVALFILGYRVDAVKVIATRVMLPRGLLGLGIDTVDHSGAEICQALSVFSWPQSMPALVHCTQGKDRTGLIIILILMILDIPTDAIEHDYLLTDAALESDREERLAEIRQLGLTDDWAVTSPVMVSGLKGHLDLQYGGLENYLDGIGFDAAQRTNLRQLLLY